MLIAEINMPRKLPREVGQYHDRALNSIRLAIEHFNRPSEDGRVEASLHFSLHAHEMLAKGSLLHRGQVIQGRREDRNIPYDTCRQRLGPDGLNVLDENDLISLTALSNVRNAAQHATVSLSEQELYLHVQAAVTVFTRLLASMFNERLADFLPARVLPVSTEPPLSMEALVGQRATHIQEILQPGKRRTSEASAALRALLAIDLAAAGLGRGATPLEVDRAATRLKNGQDWRGVLPNLAALHLDAEGTGPTYKVRIARGEGDVVARFAVNEEEAEGAAIIREINYFDKFNIKLTEFGSRLGCTQYQGHALIYALGLKDDPEVYYLRRTQQGNVQFQGLSQRGLDIARHALDDGMITIDDAVARYRQR